jgi:hypothetical protein
MAPIAAEVSLYGALRGTMLMQHDLIAPLAETWDACK